MQFVGYGERIFLISHLEMETKLKQTFDRYLRETASLSSGELIAFFLQRHPGKVSFSSSFGAEDQVLTHMLIAAGKPFRLFTLDTGRLFQETYELMEITRQRYGIPIEVYFPAAERIEEMVIQHGINLFYDSTEKRKLCCHIRKFEPLKRALAGTEIWITGIRREQSITREGTVTIEWEENLSVIKINPLADWTSDDVWTYIRNHKIPYNTLHDKGFPSIGCLPCTRAVLPGEDVRSGRWWWERPDMKECGLHVSKK